MTWASLLVWYKVLTFQVAIFVVVLALNIDIWCWTSWRILSNLIITASSAESSVSCRVRVWIWFAVSVVVSVLRGRVANPRPQPSSFLIGRRAWDRYLAELCCWVVRTGIGFEWCINLSKSKVFFYNILFFKFEGDSKKSVSIRLISMVIGSPSSLNNAKISFLIFSSFGPFASIITASSSVLSITINRFNK